MGALKEEIESRSSTESIGLLIKALEYFSAFYSLDDAFIKLVNKQSTRQYSNLTVNVLNQALIKLAADKNINIDEKAASLLQVISLHLDQLTAKKQNPEFTDLVVNEYLFNFIFHNEANNEHFQHYFLVYSEQVFDAIVQGRMSETHLIKLLENCFVYFGGQEAEVIAKVNLSDHRKDSHLFKGDQDQFPQCL